MNMVSAGLIYENGIALHRLRLLFSGKQLIPDNVTTASPRVRKLEVAMKIVRLMVMIFLVCLVLAVTVNADDAATQQMNTEEMKPMGPSEQIKESAARMVGTWNFEGQWRATADQEWQPVSGTMQVIEAVGGAALMSTWESEFMGMPMHGLSLTAYDGELGEWQETWIDNFSGRISLYTGQKRDGKRVMTGIDIYQGQKTHNRMTDYNMTDSTFDWMMEMSMDGENWFTTMKGTYTKQ
jgi:hypothetical protein